MGKSEIVERMDVRENSLYYREHLARYDLARKYVSPGPILDIASGTGYGCDLLQPIYQALVVGIDIDFPALSAARRAYANRQITFLSASGTQIPFRTETFNTITSMETLEHIQDDQGFLAELSRVVRPDGVCILSTPNRMYSLKHGITNPYHMREYSETELVDLVSRFFSSVQIFYQGFDNDYHTTVREYSDAIQSRKENLNPVLRWVINHIYRPAKKLIPTSVANYYIRKFLHLSFPTPSSAHIAISPNPVQDCSNFVLVCRKTETVVS
jgi:ubiquinone/menaquinone biosynthesis C-methylase UbiE